MTENCKYFSRNSLIAIYLLLRTLRKGVDRIELTESCIRSFLGRERLHDSTIWGLADWFRPFFPKAEIWHRKRLFLYVVKQDEADEEEDKPITASDRLRQQLKKPQKKYKTEVVHSIPEPYEIDEELIAKEVAECIFKYETIRSIISQ